ncbi:MAG TPA: hypothetical protein VK009_09460 [Chloroflexota bacterium]|nr:hypothetical protein [Chloroflexota bacterium]
MAGVSVADLLHSGRIEGIPADVAAAWLRMDEANAHLVSSAALARTDPALAYVALYDAARKAITAHMQANGYGPTNRSGAHHAVGQYAEAALASSATLADVQAFDRMRQVRNRSEYNQQPITERLLAADPRHAKAIVAVVRASLPLRPQ